MEILQTIIDHFNHFWGYIELAGVASILICVWLAVKQNIWTWFWGAVGVCFFAPMLWEYKLYSDFGLQLFFYLPMQAVGWWYWMKKGPNANNDLPVSVLKGETIIYCVIAIAVLTYMTGFFMLNFTDASFPYWDALTTWMSIFAQILMLKKICESWVLWVAVDVISVPIYFMKGMVVWSGLYGLFIVLATMGGVAWYRAYAAQQIPDAETV